MEQKTQFKLVFYGLLGSMGIYILLNYQTVHWEDMFVAMGTVTLALFTWKLALTETEESKQIRQLMITEARRERRRLRLKEQLEGLYSPLMAHIDYFDQVEEHFTRGTAVWNWAHLLRSKYEFLSSTELRSLFQDYYSLKDLEEPYEEMQKLVSEIRLRIYQDFKNLISEYQQLTEIDI